MQVATKFYKTITRETPHDSVYSQERNITYINKSNISSYYTLFNHAIWHTDETVYFYKLRTRHG